MPSAGEIELQSAISQLKTGNAGGALKTCKKLIKKYPGLSKAYQIAAMVHLQQGQLKEGMQFLRSGLAKDKNNLGMRFNLAMALYQSGELASAEQNCRQVIEAAPPTAGALCLYGDILKAMSRQQEAIVFYEKAISKKRDLLQAWNNLGNSFRELGRYNDAVKTLESAAGMAPGSAQVLFNLGIAYKDNGQLIEAEATLKKTCNLQPNNADAMTMLGEVMSARGLTSDTLDIFSEVTRLRPKDPNAFFNLGLAQATNTDPESANASFRKAIELDPTLLEAHYNLITQLEKISSLDEMEHALLAAEQIAPDDGLLKVLRAFWLKRKGDHADALESLNASGKLNTLEAQLLKATLLGQVQDRLGNALEAFDAFKEMNRLEFSRPYAKFHDKDRYLNQINEYQDLFSQTTPDQLQQEGEAPVFLVGFPRSGTTLLDTMLRGHKEIGVLEEVPIIENIQKQANITTALDLFRPDRLLSMKDAYLSEISKMKDSTAKKIWIDKLPLNLAEAGFIYSMFPDAKFIFALRHPCDAVLSCFMQQFTINDAMANFTTIGDAADTYNRVMKLWKLYQEQLPLSVHTIKYEDVVVNPEEHLVELLKFLDVPWSDEVLNYRETAKARQNINTPSYHQVTEKLYSHASGRWHRYKDQMSDVLPILEPWVKEYGYEI